MPTNEELGVDFQLVLTSDIVVLQSEPRAMYMFGHADASQTVWILVAKEQAYQHKYWLSSVWTLACICASSCDHVLKIHTVCDYGSRSIQCLLVFNHVHMYRHVVTDVFVGAMVNMTTYDYLNPLTCTRGKGFLEWIT